jgi:mono/diheme cytochrome c family protein
MIKKIVLGATSLLISIMVFQGCFYDKADVQYPASGASCDTTNVRYSVEIKAILDANCQQCHSGSSPISGFDLYDYNTISSLALDGDFTYGTLLSAVMHEGGAPFMPQDGPMLQDCDINKIAAWVHSGAPNN